MAIVSAVRSAGADADCVAFGVGGIEYAFGGLHVRGRQERDGVSLLSRGMTSSAVLRPIQFISQKPNCSFLSTASLPSSGESFFFEYRLPQVGWLTGIQS